MPTWLVKFEKPVIYRPTHPRAYRRVMVSELPVHAPTADGAKTHALRMTAGDPGEITVEPEGGAPVGIVEPVPASVPVGDLSYVATTRADRDQ